MNTPNTAYAMLSTAKWWIVVTTPSGAQVRLHQSYESRASAEHAIATMGYVQRLRPVTTIMVPPACNDTGNDR